MKRFLSFFIVIVIAVCLFSSCNTEKEPDPQKDPEVKYGQIFYVAVDGSDTNEGTKESPLATLFGAMAKVREYKSANGLPENGIKVEFAAGVYKITETIKFTPEDSGEDGKPIVYAAADGAEVIFDGGVTLNPSDFKPVNDEFKANLLTEEAKNSVLEIDLIAAGVGDLEEFQVPAAEYINVPYAEYATIDWTNVLYVNNATQTVARWPNGEYNKGKIVKGWDGNTTSLSVPSEKAALWEKYDDIHARGFYSSCWTTCYTDLAKADAATSSVAVATEYSEEETKDYYFFNIPCELDEPGEYYIDPAADKLYYWPCENFENAKISLSRNTGWFAEFDNCDYITFDGVIIENLVSGGICGTASDFTVVNSIIRCLSNGGIYLSGDRHTIKDCEICHVGYQGITLNGGDKVTKRDADTVISNNYIHDFGEVYPTPARGIRLDGCGFLVAHNEIYNAPHEAINSEAADCVIEYNNIYNVSSEVPDSGAVYSGAAYNQGGSLYRYNYIHDIVGRAGRSAGNGIYIDDTECFRTAYANILVNISGNGFALGGGRNLTIYNNVLVNTNGVSLDKRGEEWYPGSQIVYPNARLWKPMADVDLFDSVWKYAQPEMLVILEMRATPELKSLKGITCDDMDSPASPSYINFYANIGFGETAGTVSERQNFIFNRNNYLVLNAVEGDADPVSPRMASSAYRFGSVHDNIGYPEEIASDVFVDPANGNFFLKEDSRVYRDILGFEKWDYSLIGPQK